MKLRFLIILLAIICAVCCAVMFSACEDKKQSAQTGVGTQTEQSGTNSGTGGNTGSSGGTQNGNPQKPATHVHSYGNWEIISPATHTTAGTRRKYCSCGEHVDETIPKTTAHTFLPYSHKDATCTEAGEDVLRCECGAEKRNIISPSHTYDHCECTVCGAIKPGAIAVEVHVDDRLYDTVYTDAEYGYKIELPTVPPDWKVDKSILCYFDGWYTDKDYTTLATGDEVYNAPSAIYSRQFTNDKWNCDCTFSNNEATITRVNLNYGTTIFIPRYINTFPVTGIAADAFKGQTTIRYLFLSDNLRTIGEGAFEGCNSMLKVFFSEGLKSIERYAFWDCSSLTGVYITDLAAWCNIKFGDYANPLYYAHNLYLNNNPVTEITADMLQGVTEIKQYAFYKCTSLESITIPDSVTSIGNGAFEYCTKLMQTENGVVYVDKWVVGRDTSVTNVNLRTDTKGIANSAFSYCTSLTSITIPDSVTSIGEYAFRNCTSLTSITIPDSVTSIGWQAFAYCTRLTSITIPDSVTSIEYAAFSGCTSLVTVYYGGDSTQWNGISIDYYNSNLKNATRYYFSENAPDTAKWAESENWWHYDPATGEIAIWKKD